MEGLGDGYMVVVGFSFVVEFILLLFPFPGCELVVVQPAII